MLRARVSKRVSPWFSLHGDGDGGGGAAVGDDQGLGAGGGGRGHGQVQLVEADKTGGEAAELDGSGCPADGHGGVRRAWGKLCARRGFAGCGLIVDRTKAVGEDEDRGATLGGVASGDEGAGGIDDAEGAGRILGERDGVYVAPETEAVVEIDLHLHRRLALEFPGDLHVDLAGADEVEVTGQAHAAAIETDGDAGERHGGVGGFGGGTGGGR